MTLEDQMIAIGRFCGWEPCEPRVFLRFAPSHAFMKDGAYYGGFNSLPRYTEDLNAIHDAESLLTDAQHRRYRIQLRMVCHNGSREMINSRKITSATAAQRAEALLKALNLWEPSPPSETHDHGLHH